MHGLHGGHDSFVYSDMQSAVVIEKRQDPGTIAWVLLGLGLNVVAVVGAGDDGNGPQFHRPKSKLPGFILN